MRARPPVLALGLLAALALSACGSGGKSSSSRSTSTPATSSTSSSTASTSKARVIADADAICRANAGIGKVPKAKTTKQLVATLTTMEARLQDTAHGLAALKPPAEIKRPYDAYRAALTQAGRAVQQMIDSARVSNAAAFNHARLALDTFTIEAQGVAGQVGFQACGAGG